MSEWERERDLVVVVLSMEEGFLLKDHTGQHTPQAPHIKAVVIHLHGTGNRDYIIILYYIQILQYCVCVLQGYLVVHQQLWAFEIPRRHPDVVLLSWVIELSQTPVYKAQLWTQTPVTVPVPTPPLSLNHTARDGS